MIGGTGQEHAVQATKGRATLRQRDVAKPKRPMHESQWINRLEELHNSLQELRQAHLSNLVLLALDVVYMIFFVLENGFQQFLRSAVAFLGAQTDSVVVVFDGVNLQRQVVVELRGNIIAYAYFHQVADDGFALKV